MLELLILSAVKVIFIAVVIVVAMRVIRGRSQRPVPLPYWKQQQRETGLGNPQLGRAKSDTPLVMTMHPAVPTTMAGVYPDDLEPYEVVLNVCEDCDGYYMVQCPCWFFPGGRIMRGAEAHETLTGDQARFKLRVVYDRVSRWLAGEEDKHG